MISLNRPVQDILVVTDGIEKSRQLNLLWGVRSFVSNFEFKPTDAEGTKNALKDLYNNKILNKKDTVVVTAVKYPNPKVKTTMNFLEIHKIKDLADIFSWD